jgi:hypothetical protein
MPHASLKLIPGVDQNRTPALNEAAISRSNLIRFVPDRQGSALPQKLGGWEQFSVYRTTGIATALNAWADLYNNKYLGIGTRQGVYTLDGRTAPIIDRSPQRYTTSPAVDFSTTDGSSEVTIIDNGSNVTNLDSIFLATPVSIGGLVLSGFYPCIPVSADTYQIIARDILGQEVNATSTVSNGGAVPVFDTTAGSATVDVTLEDHGYTVGSTFTILIPVSVGGFVLYGDYIVTYVNPSVTNLFQIRSASTASTTDTADLNGGYAYIIYFVSGSTTEVSPTSGYGYGGYGAGTYGSGVTSTGFRSFALTGVSCTGTIAKFEFAGKYSVPVGSTFTVAGVTPSGYNTGSGQQWTVLESDAAFTGSYVTADIGASLAAGTGGDMTITRFAFTAATDWSLSNWGQFLMASPKGGPVYYYDPTLSGQTCAIVPNSPIVNEGFFIAMPERQIIAYGSTFTGIQDPLLVRWCDIGNFSSWVGTVTNQAGSFRLSSGSKIVGGLQAPQQGLLWTDVGLWSMQYINLPYVWSFNEIGTGCGLIAQKAAGSMQGTVYWMGKNQFFQLGAEGVQAIACPIWDVIFQDLDTDNVDNIRCATNSSFSEVTWYYPISGSYGIPVKYVKYNTLIGQWDYGVLPRTAWLDQSVWGQPIGAGVDQYLYQHETSKEFPGLPDRDLPIFETGLFALMDGDQKVFIDQLWPDMKWGYFGSDDQDGRVYITIRAYDYPYQETPTQVFGPQLVTRDTTYITPRIRGRLFSIAIGSADQNTFWRLGNIRYRMQPDGRF